METNKVYFKTEEEKLKSLIADEAKQSAMLNDMADTLRQLRAKSSFRIALCNQLLQSLTNKENKS
jgi:hypothetical protein